MVMGGHSDAGLRYSIILDKFGFRNAADRKIAILIKFAFYAARTACGH